MTKDNVAGELDEKQTQIAYTQAKTIADAANISAVNDSQFVFFAAFDGTRNDMKNVALSGNALDTNVAQLYNQARKIVEANKDGNLSAGYYPGHGTDGSLVASAWLPFQVTQETVNSAQKAYDEFASEASVWLKKHPKGEVTTAITAFSRGGATAAVFTHMLYKDGLIDPETKEVLIPPGKVGVSAGVIFDPVATGVAANVAFAPNVKNIAVIRAENEYRYLFQAVDYNNQPGIHIFTAMGNHCGIGGGYDNGLGALYLEAATRYLQKSGLHIAEVDISRRLDPTAPLLVYDESGTKPDQARNPLNQEQNQGQWSVYAYFKKGAVTQAERLLDNITQPAQEKILAESTVKDFVLYNKQHAIEILTEDQSKAKVYLEEAPEQAIKKHPDLFGALSLKASFLREISDQTINNQQFLIKQFDTRMVANIERGLVPLTPTSMQDLDCTASHSVGDVATMQAKFN